MTVQGAVAEPHLHQIHLVAVARAAVAEVVVEINLIFKIYMKKTVPLYYMALSLAIFSCKSENKENEQQITDTEQITQPKNEKPAYKKEIQEIYLSEYSKLTPIELKESKSKNVFKKYGTEFSGNCYACDLAIFKLNKKNFDIVNVCDDNDFQRFEDFK